MNIELDAGDFEPLPQVAAPVASESIETESQSGKGSKGAKEGGSGGAGSIGSPQTIKTSPKRDWDRRKVIDWDSIKEAMIAGMGAEDCAARYGSTAGSIRVRSHTEQWPTPERIKREAEKRIREAQADLQRAREMRQRKPGPMARPPSNGFDEFDGSETWRLEEAGGNGEAGGIVDWNSGEGGGLRASSATPRRNSNLVMLAGDRVEMAEQGITDAMRHAFSAIKRAPKLTIETLAELQVAMKLLKNGADMDGPQMSMSLGFFTSSQPDAASLGVVLEAEDVGE